jgi:hypothetical protein
LKRTDFKCKTGEKVNNIIKAEDGNFVVTTGKVHIAPVTLFSLLANPAARENLALKAKSFPRSCTA